MLYRMAAFVRSHTDCSDRIIVTTIKRNQEDMRTSAIVLTHPSYQCHERGG